MSAPISGAGTDRPTFYQRVRHEVRRQQRLLQMKAALRRTGRETAMALSNEPISVYGLFSMPSGLGEAARRLADGVEGLGHTVRRIDVTPLLGHKSGGKSAPIPSGIEPWDEDPGDGPIIVHLNPVEATEIMMRLSPPRLAQRLRIGVWIYELDHAPAHWQAYIPLFDAIWTPSDSSAASLRTLGAHVQTVPYRHPAHPPPNDLSLDEQKSKDNADRAASGPRPFTVMVLADARSSLARKNVQGSIDAFHRAFPNADSASVRLLLKLSNLPHGHGLRGLSAPSAELLTGTLSPAVVKSMIRNADAVLSLHRAEGYGLTLVEALICGTALIMSDEPTTRSLQIKGSVWPVPTQPIPIEDPQTIYRGGFWHDADIDAAASRLTEVYAVWQSGDLSANRAARARAADALFCDQKRLEPLRQALRDLGITTPQ